MSEPNPFEQCSHSFVWLRQERKNIGYDRNPIYGVDDIFFCQKCLEYRRVTIEKRRPRSDSFADEIVERLV